MADSSLPPITDKLKARFWAKVDVRGPDDCWNWTACADQRGYGRIGNWTNGKTIPILATHVSLTLDGRGRPTGALALHSCDNPSCVNPRHLRWGSADENAMDKISRGRAVPTEQHQRTMRRVAARGPGHCCARLSSAEVKAIIDDPRLHREIAADYGVSRSYVGELKAGLKRRHG